MERNYLYEIALTKVQTVGNKKSKLLLAYCGGAEGVFAQSKQALAKIPGIGAMTAKKIKDSDPEKVAGKDIEYIAKIILRYHIFSTILLILSG